MNRTSYSAVITVLLAACSSAPTGDVADDAATLDGADSGGSDIESDESDASGSDGSGTPDTQSDTTPGDDTTGEADATPDPDAPSEVDANPGEDAAGDTTADDGSSGDAGTTDDGCPDELFIQAAAHPDNSEYAAPRLTARCEDGELLVSSNGIIGFEFQAMTPNALQAQNHNWAIPLEPEYSETTTEVALLGDIGFSVSGIVLYGPNEALIPDPYGDPVYNDIVDWCLGHTGAGGTYHFHAMLVECIVDGVTGDGPSPIIGYALDGFPIYGPIACMNADCSETATMQSGWVQIADPSTYAWDAHEYRASEDPTVLDECNGRFAPDGTYGYHVTATFPYILGCYHGVYGEGGGGDPPDEPTACGELAECPETCGPDGRACACAETPRGSQCVPSCDTAADCPTGAPVTLACIEGACVPAR